MVEISPGGGPVIQTGRGLIELSMVRPEGRSEAEIGRLIRSLDITVTFSGEKWNMIYEQHGTTTGIGPRSQEKLRMEGVVKGEGILRSLEPGE